MSCYNQCLPCLPCGPCGPTPLANSCNEPCVQQCQDSTVVIQPSPVVNTAVGSSTSAAVGSILSSQGVPISSGGFGLSGLGSGYCGRRNLCGCCPSRASYSGSGSSLEARNDNMPSSAGCALRPR
ncbi:Feather keratin 1 [Aix galericulata]|nr:Feather keratin 1 [Aix galericulata]